MEASPPIEETSLQDWRKTLEVNLTGTFAASKHGVRGLTGVMNEEGKAHAIRATLLSLGAVYTAFWKSRPEFSPADMLSVDDVAECICEIARKPLHIRVDELRLVPSKGVL